MVAHSWGKFPPCHWRWSLASCFIIKLQFIIDFCGEGGRFNDSYPFHHDDYPLIDSRKVDGNAVFTFLSLSHGISENLFWKFTGSWKMPRKARATSGTTLPLWSCLHTFPDFFTVLLSHANFHAFHNSIHEFIFMKLNLILL